MADDVVNVQYNIQNEYTNYDFVRSIENILVENRLVQYSQGILSNTLDYNKEHVYNRLNIAFMTDSHFDLGNAEANRQNVIDAIDFCNNVKVPISVIIEGGDLRTWYLKDKKKTNISMT